MNSNVTSPTRLPIAMLHHVADESAWSSLAPFIIQKKTFSLFLDSIERANRWGQSLEKASKTNPGKSVAITFDDCGRHLLDFAIPELTRRGMTASFFFPTAHLSGFNTWDVQEGKPKVELMTSNDLVSLHSLGMEIGTHGHDHIHLAELPEKEALKQLKQSKSILDSILGQPIANMAWPYGSTPKNAYQLLLDSGHKLGCSIFSSKGDNSSLRRFIVHDGDTAKSFALKFGTGYRVYRSCTDWRKC